MSGTEKVLSATVEEQVASPAPRPADAPSPRPGPLLGFPCGLPCLPWSPKTGVLTTHCGGKDTLGAPRPPAGFPEVLVLAKGGVGPPSPAPLQPPRPTVLCTQSELGMVCRVPSVACRWVC